MARSSSMILCLSLEFRVSVLVSACDTVCCVSQVCVPSFSALMRKRLGIILVLCTRTAVAFKAVVLELPCTHRFVPGHVAVGKGDLVTGLDIVDDVHRFLADGSVPAEGCVWVAGVVEASGVGEDGGAVIHFHAVGLKDADQGRFGADAGSVLLLDALAFATLLYWRCLLAILLATLSVHGWPGVLTIA